MQKTSETSRALLGDDFLAAGGEMSERIRSFDWSRTPLGPVETWPQSLMIAVRIMLSSRQPIWLGWGEQLIKLYNDPYKDIVGGKHPAALGQPASVVWREIWDEIGPLLETAMGGVEGTYVEAQLLIMERNGYPEETHYTYSYSPIPNDQGGVGGIICANTDDTARVIGERQLALLRELATRMADARTFDEACALSAQCLETNPQDLPFALIYLVQPDQQSALLAGSSGIEPGHAAAAEKIAFAGDSVWPLAEVVRTSQPCLISDLGAIFEHLPLGAWPRPPHQAVAVPIAASGQTGKTGVLIAGLNPFRLFDDNYQRFIDLVVSQIAASIGNAQAYEEERQRAEALAEIDRAKTAFFSNVSHEFRTPLTLMLGPLADLLAQNGALPAAARDELEVVHRNGQRLLKLVNTLLDFSRIEAGRLQASYEPTDLPALTAELASVFRSAIERAGLQLIVDCPPLGEPVYVDRELWEKIVLNLLSNAFKFTFAGRIEVSLKFVVPPSGGSAGSQALPAKAGTTNYVELTVRDTGTGIPAAELPHLFERFHRVAGARGRSVEGSGIGLALVRELARLHGGTVSVESELERGSTFVVSIPLGTAHLPAERVHQSSGAARTLSSTGLRGEAYAQEASRWLPDVAQAVEPADDFVSQPLKAQQRAASASGPQAGQSALQRILLADDNADMREYVQRLLSRDYEVVAVSDGAAALRAAREQAFDLVLTDVMMPQLDGFGLLRELRAAEQTKTLPVILLSARAGEESRLEGLGAGADDYLVKPFSARELLARVAAHLQLRRVRGEAAAARAQAQAVLASIRDACSAFDRDWRYTYINEQGLQLTGLRRADFAGRTLWEVFPDLVGTAFETQLRQAMQNGAATTFESYYAPWRRWLENRAYPTADGLSLFTTDITERKRADQHQKLLFDIAEKIRQATQPADLLFDVAHAVGEHLQARRCLFNEIDLANDRETVHRDYCRGVASVAGVHRVSDYSATTLAEMAAGRTVVNCDAQADPRTADYYERTYAPNGERAYVAVPLLRQGRWSAALWVSDDQPRNWSEAEISLLEALAERTWLALEKLRSEAALRESEEKYRTLFDSIDEGFCTIQVLFDDEGQPFNYRFLDINPAFIQQTDLTDAVGKTMLDFAPEMEAYWFEIYGRVATTGESVRFENRAAQLHRWYDVYAFRVGAPADHKVGVLFNDISERKRAELNAALLAAISQDLTLLADGREVMKSCGARIGEYFGCDQCVFAEFDERADTATVIYAWRKDETTFDATGTYRMEDFVTREIQTLLASGQPLVISDVFADARIHNKEAQREFGIAAAVNAPFVSAGSLKAAIGLNCGDARAWRADEIELLQELARRIWTRLERARAEAALQQALAELQATYEQSPVGLLQLDADLRYIRINEELAAMNGLPAAEHFGKTIHEIVPDLAPKVEADYRRILATGEPVLDIELTGETSADPGVQHTWLESWYPLRDAGGQVIGLNVVAQDITARKQAEAALRAAMEREQVLREKAEEANRLKDEFLAVVSHELKTPLHAINGWATLLHGGLLTGEQARQGVETIVRNAKVQKQIIDDLLDVSRIITGKMRLAVGPVRLGAVIEAAIETVRPAAEAKGIRLSVLLDPAADAVSGDAERLQQVCWNLLTNAIKFTPKGGRVQVRLERVNSHVEITVADNGQGIKAEFLPHVFDRFRQEEGGTTRQHGGLGLGLAIVRHLVELHGGTVHVHSAGEGQGATFTVVLPVVPMRTPSAEERRGLAADTRAALENLPSLAGVRVLLVDDDADGRALVTLMLAQSGAEVRTAGSAAEALAALEHWRPDVLISDIGMPDEDGYALLEKLRAQERERGARRLPAVALTAYARLEDRLRALAVGYQMHIAKPVEPAELLTVVASLVNRGGGN